MLVILIAQVGGGGWTSLVPIAIGIFGLGGLIFTALRFRRDDTTAVVTQQSQIVGSMKTLNDELRVTADNLRQERDGLRAEVERLSGQVEALRGELRDARESLSGQMTQIHDKLEENGESK